MVAANREEADSQCHGIDRIASCPESRHRLHQVSGHFRQTSEVLRRLLQPQLPSGARPVAVTLWAWNSYCLGVGIPFERMRQEQRELDMCRSSGEI